MFQHIQKSSTGFSFLFLQLNKYCVTTLQSQKYYLSKMQKNERESNQICLESIKSSGCPSIT